MSATDNPFALYGMLSTAVDERTIEILTRRREGTTIRRRGWLVRRVLLAADLIGLIFAMLLAEWITSGRSFGPVIAHPTEVGIFLASLPAWVVVCKLYGLYDRDEEWADHSTADDAVHIFHMVTVCTGAFAVGSYLLRFAHPTPPKLLIFWATAIALVPIARALGRASARRSVLYLQNAVIVGAGDVGQQIAKKILQHPEYGLNLVGFVDAEPRERRDDLQHLAILGGIDDLPELVQLLDVDRIIVAFSNESHETMLDSIQELKDAEIQVDVVPRLFETIGLRAAIHMVEGLPLIGIPPRKLSRSSQLLKRGLDVILAGGAVIVGSPLLVAIAIAVKLDSGGPAFYRHRRIGQGGRDMDVFKFRTMRLEACRGDRYGGQTAEEEFAALMNDPSRLEEFATTYKIAEDPRVTRVGSFLRKTSLDELPQLFNVIRGDLSLVGPRPITDDELDRYDEWRDALLSLPPGVTGYWQVNGRSQLAYEDRVRLDVSYIQNWSLGLDLKILARTVRVLLTRRGAV